MIKIKKSTINIDDLFKLKLISGMDFSPDGNRICYSLRYGCTNDNTYYSHLYMIDLKKNTNRQLSFGKRDDQNPKFVKNGTEIIFSGSRDEFKSLYIIPCDGGEARKLVNLEGNFSNYSISSDNRIIALFNKKTDYEEKIDLIKKIDYKNNGEKSFNKDKNRLCLINIEDNSWKFLTDGKYDCSDPQFSPDNRKIVFVSNFSKNSDISGDLKHLYLTDLKTFKTKKISRLNGPKMSPVFDKTGKNIIFYAHEGKRGRFMVENLLIYSLNIKSGISKCLLNNFDRTCLSLVATDCKSFGGYGSPPLFSKDYKEIYFQASSEGSVHIYSLERKTGKIKQITHGNSSIPFFTVNSSGDKLALIASDSLNVNEIAVVNRKFKQISEINDRTMKNKTLSIPEEIRIKSDSGQMIHGWIMLPPDFNKKKKYPLILQIHGGPHLMYGNSFYHEFQYLAANGFIVAYCNPRGSQGYGKKHVSSLIKNWGKVDYEDMMSFTDHLENLPFVDKKRMGITGGSYGGYLTNWIITQTDRFKAAVTQRSLSNMHSFYGTSDCGTEFDFQFNGTPWKKPENLLEISPITYVNKIKTPLLIIHGEEDHRTPIEQAEQLFTALRYLKKEVEFMRIPGENHDLSRNGKPENRIARLKAIRNWFEDKLK